MRGRPIGSNANIRENIKNILKEIGKAHGYKIYKEHNKRFPETSLRNIYYHLQKGVKLKIFKMSKGKIEGNYSWGKSANIEIYQLQ